MSQLEELIKRIKFQHDRITKEYKEFMKRLEKKDYDTGSSIMGHDADYYFILARRTYRLLELLTQVDGKIANLKGKNKALLAKLKIRDFSEHWEGWDRFPTINSGSIIKVSMEFKLNKDEIVLTSGNLEWNFIQEHARLIEILNEVLELIKQNKKDKYEEFTFTKK